MKRKTVKCRYDYCKHESKDIPRDLAVGASGKYYHADCFKERTEKKQIVDLFFKEINPNTPPKQLWRVVTDLVNERGFSSEFVLYGLKYYIRHKIKIRYPGGLYYVVANQDVKEEYYRAKSIVEKQTFDIIEDIGTSFTYKKPPKKTLDNLLSG